MKYFVFTLFVLAILLISCKNHKDQKTEPNEYISFKVDSIVIYDASGIPKNEFIFSPISKQNKIWTINTDHIHELDLVSGKWAPLTSKFGDEFKRQVRNDGIWKDTFTDDVYISCFYDCLIQYKIEEDTFYKIDIHPVTSFFARQSDILLGTANGLFFLNRKFRTIEKAPNFPNDIWVGKINKIGKDSLSINNGKYIYELVLPNMTKTNDENKRPNNYQSIKPLIKKLPRGDFYKIVKHDSISWIYEKSSLYYSIDNRLTFKFLKLPKGYLRHIVEDQQYLFLLYNDKFIILNKQYVLRNSIFFDTNKYQKKLRELYSFQNLNSLNNPTSLNSLIMLIDSIQSNTTFNEYDDLKQMLTGFSRQVYGLNRNDKLRVQVEKAISENRLADKYLKYALNALSQFYTRKVELDKAIAYHDLLVKKFPEFDDYGVSSVMPCVKKVKTSIDSLEKLPLSEDEKLYKLGLLKERLVGCGWFGESHLNFSIVCETFKNLVHKFPNSEYADNAELFLLNAKSNGDEGIEYSSELITEYRKFINKYSNSELIPEVKLHIAQIYSAYFGEADEKIKMLNKASQELFDLKKKYPNMDSITFQNVSYQKEKIKKEKINITFELIVKSKKESYNLGEDVIIDVKLVNKTSVPQEISLYSNNSHFATYIYFSKENPTFINSNLEDTLGIDIAIKKGNPLQQTIILNKETRYVKNGELGRFEFKTEGLYFLSVFTKNRHLHSKQIKFYINKGN